MKKNDIIELEITGTTSEGNGVGRYDGMAVFVPASAEGDVLKVLIVKVKKSYAYGKIVEIITPSADRVEDNCDVYLKCGGCVFRHINYSKECEIKQSVVQNNLKRIGGFDISVEPIIFDKSEKYRNKAQYPIGLSKDGKVLAGFYAQHSHRVIDNMCCNLQPDIYGDILKTVKSFIEENNISVYSEELHKGLVRHVYMRIAEATGEVMVVIVINGNDLPKKDILLDSLKNLLGDRLKSFQLNINEKETNVILGEKCVTVFGQDYITDILCGLKIRLSALSFYQVNHDMAEKLYKKAAFYAEPEGKTVLDLYCGAGTIGLSMADNAKQIIGVEIVPQAVEDARVNAAENGITNARFICADAAEAAKKLSDEGIAPDVVIVDPPRKGCEAELINTIANDFKPQRIVYVSCDSATLARDCRLFSDLGYNLKSATPADLFPRTAHVECVCLITSNKC